MNYKTQNEALERIAKKIAPKFNRAEEILALVVLFIFIARITTDISTALLLQIGIMSLSALYFFGAYIPNNLESKFEKFIIKVNFLASSVALVGVLYSIMHWPFSYTMLYLGGFSVALVLLITLFWKLNKKLPELIDFPFFIRALIIVLLAGFFVFSSYEDRVKLGIEKSRFQEQPIEHVEEPIFQDTIQSVNE